MEIKTALIYTREKTNTLTNCFTLN